MRPALPCLVALLGFYCGCSEHASTAMSVGGASGATAGSGSWGGTAGLAGAAAGAAGASGGNLTGGSGSAGSPSGGEPPDAHDCAKLLLKSGPQSEWVYFDEQGTLAYAELDAHHNRIIDYSHAGYRGGGVALPHVAVAMTLGPSGADDTATIQAALDTLAERSAIDSVDGWRGALLLEPGTYRLAGTLRITASGIVLRGSGSGSGGTLLELTGAPHSF